MKSPRPASEPRSKTVQITITCAGCGEEFEPHRDAFLHGDWRRCPDCRALAVHPHEEEVDAA